MKCVDHHVTLLPLGAADSADRLRRRPFATLRLCFVCNTYSGRKLGSELCPDGGAAFVLFGAKIAAGGAQKAKMVMMWVEHRGTLAGLVLFFHQVGELQRHRVNLNRPLKLK